MADQWFTNVYTKKPEIPQRPAESTPVRGGGPINAPANSLGMPDQSGQQGPTNANGTSQGPDLNQPSAGPGDSAYRPPYGQPGGGASWTVPNPGAGAYRPPNPGWGFPVMGQPFYGGAGTRQPPAYGGGFPPGAGFTGAPNYPTPGNTYPIQGRGLRPAYGNPWAAYGQPYQPFPSQRGGGPFAGGGGFVLNTPPPQQAYEALQGRW